ncbi:hypothetical protein [Deinococcus wulumuqiensis]|uniref:Tetrapyrrole biosynthesis uroporphyrinogen III synthase domain-containing protein n=1 Tax=Deinococcus wulumuqiensis TaxID=980427 RepID=A0AAV4K9F8_9DEIO|nr:hypothetical protein [Deinococcus wulumuqiensis]QII21252.1 hypothetical protein G6R31_11235 [Deinococcus wulumuqiensis R12]GGI92036.1 hypothetical protein GCM10010914_28170 [Deinococcus wulumuqiensis]GGP31010.1 hypothetical protein GCM10008021_26610 [Deinococcus wulumuqiensis]
MKVGLLNSPAAPLSPYWAAYLKELGVPTQTPALSDAEALALGAQSLPAESPAVQLVLGRILALERVDAALLTEWPAVAGDAWSEALSELLPRRISGLPTLIAVPERGGDLDALEAQAAGVGVRLSQNPGGVRLALERVRPLAQPARADLPALSRASRTTVAVIGPRPLLQEPVLASGLRPALEALDLHPVFSYEVPYADALRRAERLEDAHKVPAGERELFGAASLLAGKGAVAGLVLVAPARDGATQDALSRVAGRLHKPALHLTLDAGQEEWPELDTFAARLTQGATGRRPASTQESGE